MSAENVAALVAAALCATAALVALAVVIVLSRRLRELRDVVRDLRNETVPLVRDARVVVDQAATEMLRVGDVLSSTEAVSGTVDSASRLAYRAFANPVVRVLAFWTGTRGALRRLFAPRSRALSRTSSSSVVVEPAHQREGTTVASIHRRRLRARARR
jgi:hypothetical protein